MTPREFREIRHRLDLTLPEMAQFLGDTLSSVACYESGEHTISGSVTARLREAFRLHMSAYSGSDVRRTIENRCSNLLPRLYLGEVPDGWLPIMERLLDEIAARCPDPCRDGESLGLGAKEKYGDLVLSPYVDHHNGDDGIAFARWLWKRVDEATAEAERTCAKCGASGREADVEFTKRGWILPLCKRHRLMKEGKL